MLASNSIISKKITNVLFAYYSAEEIRSMSVKEISNPKAFD
jgi:DNA-directed RNA polymerase beta' subunit